MARTFDLGGKQGLASSGSAGESTSWACTAFVNPSNPSPTSRMFDPEPVMVAEGDSRIG
jgi:hypothetical protein